MAVESNIKERKIDPTSERLDKLKRRRIEIKPEKPKIPTENEAVSSKLSSELNLPDFPNFPLIPLVQPNNNLNLTHNFDGKNNVTSVERLPKAEPLQMTDLTSSGSFPPHRRRLPVNLTPPKKGASKEKLPMFEY